MQFKVYWITVSRLEPAAGRGLGLLSVVFPEVGASRPEWTCECGCLQRPTWPGVRAL